MIPQITEALSSGFTSTQIIDFLIKKSPQFAKQIKKALSAGFSSDQVVKYLSGGRGADLEYSPQETSYERTRNADIKQREDVNKAGLAVGGLAATSLAAPMAASALQRAIPSSLSGVLPSLMSNNTQSLSPGQDPIKNTVHSDIPLQPPVEGTSVTQPQVINNSKEYLEKLGVKEAVDDLLKRGNSPEQTAAALGIKMGKGKVKSEIDPELLANIEAYAKTEKEQPQVSAPMEPTSKGLDAAKEVEMPKIAKNETVATPHGVGEVKEIRNGQAIIDVDGKLHKVKEEELEASPIPEKDLAALYDELIQGIESETGEDVSRMVQWAGYNPETNTLQFLPHTGKLYKYSNISPEDAALLRDILSTRKTSGENFIGAWKAGSKSPIGAALSKLIRKLQAERGGKGNEYEETHEPIYSAYEPAIQAKKKKKKK